MNIQKNCQCPDHLPEEFWDADQGQVRVDELSAAYEAMKAQTQAVMRPKSPQDYKVSCKSDLMASDEMVNERLFEAGFSNDQVQLVYDLAHDVLEPVMAQMISILYQQNQLERLIDKFGGEERWQEISRQIRAWGERKLPRHAFEAMACNYDGVMALYNMMGAGEPGMGMQAPADFVGGESDVRKLMRDPRYWRDQDPVVVAQVRDGFRRLYPG